jgi:UDP-N-acetylmuramate--alanine ligase
MQQSKIHEISETLKRIHSGISPQILFIDTVKQKMYLQEAENTVQTFNISTAKLGVGNQEGSYKTPQGIHRIVEKIGAGAPAGRIFKDRNDTGVDWNPNLTDENLILTRILRLTGLEEGINKGPGIDSYERYIYIHGTNHEEKIGSPNTHGCVCMNNKDIIELFEIIEEGTIVVID